MGWFSDFVSDPIGTVGDTGQKIIDNPVPAITAYATGNPVSLLGYTQSAPTAGNKASSGTGGGLNMAQLGFGLADLYGRQQAAKTMQDRFNQVNQQISGMYAPGSPEYNALKTEMERKDAAAGRNSQYGPRLSELGGKIAGLKGNLLSQTLGNQNNLLTAGLATGTSSYGSLANMFGQNAGNNANTNSLLNLRNLFGDSNSPSWTSGTDVMPTPTFDGGGVDMLDPELQTLLGL